MFSKTHKSQWRDAKSLKKKPERKEKKKRRKISTYRDVYIRREEVRVRAGVCDPI